MTETSNSNHVRRFVTDTLAGAGVFGLLTTMVAGTSTFAATFTLADTQTSNIAMANASGGEGSILVLAIVFSVLFAFNAAFFRHLGRAYIGATRRK